MNYVPNGLNSNRCCASSLMNIFNRNECSVIIILLVLETAITLDDFNIIKVLLGHYSGRDVQNFFICRIANATTNAGTIGEA